MTMETQGIPSVMADNTVLENISPIKGVKRKAEEGSKDEVSTPVKVAVASTGKDSGSAKKAKKTEKAPLLDLKKRRITLKQDPRPLESLLRHDCFTSLLRDFHSYLDSLSAPLESIPERFDGLIVLAGHESAAGTLTTLTKALRTHLDKPAFDFGDSQGSSTSGVGAGTISTSAISLSITRLLTQVPYGFTLSDITPTSTTSSAPPPPKLPSALQYTRWEASSVLQDLYFPPQARDVMRARHEERVKLREECERVIEGLEVDSRLELLGISNTAPKRKERDSSIEIIEPEPTPSVRSVSKSKERSASPVKRAKAKKPEDDETRKKREEKEAKKAERDKKAAEKVALAAEKLAVKEQAEKQKEKQKQTLSNFFGKAPAEASTSRQPSPVKMAATAKSDYERTFLPFAKKQDVILAPINRFKRWGGKGLFNGSKVASVEELSKWDEDGAPEVRDWDKRAFLNHHLNRFPKTERRRLTEGLKTAPPDISVREVWEAHIDAELSGTQDPRKVLAQLNDRGRFPWKTLLFEGQKRPPYSGTFTKRSAVVGPRTPFAQDPIFEYGYDSDEEWEEAGGDDVDEQPKDDVPEDEEDFGSEEDGEFDDWLDDSEDVVMGSPASEDIQLSASDGMPAVVKPVVKKERVVKRIQKLPVIVKGPVWETQIGEEGEEGLGAFRIQLLNNAPFPIDPFKWQSADSQPTLTAQRGVAVVGLRKDVPCLIDTKTSMAPPPVPIATPAVKIPSTANGDAPVTKLKARPAVPKIAFPDAYLAELLRIVEGSEKSQVDLSAELRQRFEKITTKVAIETKLKEVASKARAKGAKWIVNPSAWQKANSFTANSA